MMKIMNVLDYSIESETIKEKEYIDICNFLKEINDKYLNESNKSNSSFFRQNLALHDRVLYRQDHINVVWCTIVAKFEHNTRYLIQIIDTNDVREVDQFELYNVHFPNILKDNLDRTIPHPDIQIPAKISTDVKYLDFIRAHCKIKNKDKMKTIKSFPSSRHFFNFTLAQKETCVLRHCTRQQLHALYVHERNNRCKQKKEYIDIKKSYREIIGRDIKLCFD